ncbi:hypothetical protein L6R46_10525 [Myxococcota bacterium]|nr:hypothetical protein [Myxococcota bacterium]
MDKRTSWRDLASAYDWRPIPGCPGRFVLCGGKSALHPAAFVGGATVWPERRVPGARDPVVVVPLAEGGLLSYRHEDGRWTHTLGDGDGFGRKLAQLGIEGG